MVVSRMHLEEKMHYYLQQLYFSLDRVYVVHLQVYGLWLFQEPLQVLVAVV